MTKHHPIIFLNRKLLWSKKGFFSFVDIFTAQ